MTRRGVNERPAQTGTSWDAIHIFKLHSLTKVSLSETQKMFGNALYRIVTGQLIFWQGRHPILEYQPINTSHFWKDWINKENL